MKFATLCSAAATLASAASAFAYALPPDPVARELGGLSGGAWGEQLNARAQLEPRIVWNPKITQPNTGETFVSGVPTVVKWDTSSAPEGYNLDSPVAIKLGYDDGTNNLHEFWDLVTTEDNIPIGRGHTIVKLPEGLATRSDYIVIVFGDSGNESGKFKIVPKPSWA